MPSLESIKENIYSLVVKAGGRVTIDRILRWAEENSVGILAIALALRELERSKRVRTTGEAKVVATWQLSTGVYRIVLPEVIELTHISKAVAPSSRRTRTGTLISELLGIEDKAKKPTKAEKKTVQKQQTTSISQEISIELKGVPTTVAEHEEKTKLTTPATCRSAEAKVETRERPQAQSEALSDSLRNAVRVLSLEYGVSEKIAEVLLHSILQYLSVNWSVGEVRLRLDLTKMLSKKLNIDQETLFDVIGKALRVLRRFDIIEIVEPGIVNLLRKDLVRQQRVTFSEVLGL